jgi:hypothetical protein
VTLVVAEGRPFPSKVSLLRMEQEAPAGWEFFDSVDFPTDRTDDPMGRPRVRHVVTAVVVGHEGAAWLPRLS